MSEGDAWAAGSPACHPISKVTVTLAASLALIGCGGQPPQRVSAPHDAAVDAVSSESGPTDPCSGAGDDAGGPADCAHPVQVRWVRQPSNSGRRMSSGVVALPDGSVAATGAFSGEVTFGTGEIGETTLMASDNSDQDIFVAKYLPNGDLAWAKRAGGTGEDTGSQIVALQDGGMIVTTTSKSGGGSSVLFGPGEPGAIRLNLSAQSTVMIAKYESGGALVWAKHVSGTGERVSGGLTAFPDGSIAVTGCFNLMSTFGSGENGETSLSSSGPTTEMYGNPFDAFVAKYESNGTLAWAKRVSAPQGGACGNGIAALPDGGIAVTGRFSGGITFGEGDRSETLASVGATDAFVASYDAAGALVWALGAGDSRNQSGTGIAAFVDGDVLVSGYQGGVPTGGVDEGQSFLVARYDRQGAQRWAARATATDPTESRAIATLTDGNAVVAGTFYRTTTFGSGQPNVVTLGSERRDPNIFLVRYDVDGRLVRAIGIGGQGWDEAPTIAAHHDGDVVVTGTISTGTWSESATLGDTGVTLEPGFFIAKLAL